MITVHHNSCPFCGSSDLKVAQKFSSKPEGETTFETIDYSHYYREILHCQNCGHFLASHKIDVTKLYKGDYLSSNYKDNSGILKAYERIMNLKHVDSDNSHRVERLLNFTSDHFQSLKKIDILDIGSGLCVFLGKIKERTNWRCTAVESDERYCKHAKETLNIEVASKDYLTIKWRSKFNLITLNKVLEHLEEPVKMLKKCASDLESDGLVYIELPDGESASNDQIGYNRQEFFVDHYHAFSMSSLALLVKKSGLKLLALERLREPSRKYTLRAFLTNL